jgi:hypothetical protein
MSGNDIFYFNDLSLTPDSVSSKYCTKYEKKVLVYLVMSPKGMCTPYFRPSGLAINQDVYLEDYIKKTSTIHTKTLSGRSIRVLA